jgi:PAS domain-containing protein
MPCKEYFKSSTDDSFIIDRLGQIAEANPAAERLFRYAEKRIHEKKGIVGSSTTSRQPRNYN